MKEINLINSDKKTIVDDEDFKKFSKINWRLSPQGYVFRQIRIGERKLNKRKYIFLHKEILQTETEIVDHKDRNKLNNCKNNLRLANNSQNSRNRSKTKKAHSIYHGVTKGRNNKFVSYITYNSKKYYFGTNHKTELEAAIAYNKGIEKFKDDFIPINIILKSELK